MFIVKKKVGNKKYYYLRTSKRVDGKVKAVNIAYLGANLEQAQKRAEQFKKNPPQKVKTQTHKQTLPPKPHPQNEQTLPPIKQQPNHPAQQQIPKTQEEKDFISFVQEAGLIWGPSPEIYGGLAGFYTYGPLGKLLKNKVENSVRRVFNSNDFRELEGPTILPDVVWKASGHLDTFKDRTIRCKNCNSIFRADKLIEENHDVSADAFSDAQILDFIKQKGIKCPSCKGTFIPKIQTQSLMMKTEVAGEPASLRPETATGTYLPFLRFYTYFRKKLPFGVFQIGKAYRNEISPRQSVLRGREFTQAEGQIFIDPKEKNNWPKFEEIKNEKLPLWPHDQKEPTPTPLNQAINKKLIQSKAYAWCLHLAFTQFINFGIPKERIRIRQHAPDEKAFYADDAWDIEVKLNNYNWVEMCGVHDRTDYDLTQHSKHSNTPLQAQRENGEKFTPHILEIAFGTDRPTYALIDLFYEKKTEEQGKTKFSIPYHMAPIDISVFPLMKKPELLKLSQDIKTELERDFIVNYDISGSIGKRYLRSSTAGVPFAITIDFDSLEKNDVTIRDRDTEKQVRVPLVALRTTIHKLLNGRIRFDKAGTLIE